MFSRPSSARNLTALILLLAIQGCTNQKQPTTTDLKTNEFESDASKPRVIDMTKAPKSSEHFDVDPCPERLHSIEGQLITYYAFRRELPRDLAELAKYADAGETTDYTCPVSHQTYVYVPTGLALGNDVTKGILILYDAKPVHDSTRGPMRWGILFTEARGREPVKTQVIPVPEDVMAGFVPIPPRQNPVVTPRKPQPGVQPQ